jgi:hypothetical protein
LLHCVARHFKTGEHVWVDPRTGRKVLAQGCTNPIEREEGQQQTDECVFKDVQMIQGQILRFKQYGPKDIAKHPCTALLRAGETEWESPFVEHCPDVTCSFAYVDAALGESGWETGSFVAVESGIQRFRLPPEMADKNSGLRMVDCLDSGGEHSCGMGVQWFDYVPVNGHKVATTYYSKWDAEHTGPKHDTPAMTALHDVDGSGKLVSVPTNLWWRFQVSCYGQ